jgi:hypothetical protein
MALKNSTGNQAAFLTIIVSLCLFACDGTNSLPAASQSPDGSNGPQATASPSPSPDATTGATVEATPSPGAATPSPSPAGTASPGATAGPGISLKLDFTYGTPYPSPNSTYDNIYVAWAQSADGSIQNLNVCEKLIKGGLTDTALPRWKKTVYPLSIKAEVDAVTAPSKAKQNISVTRPLKPGFPRRFTVYYETDQSFDANDWFSNQPAILYAADIDLDALPASKAYALSFVGWVPNEATVGAIPSISPNPSVGSLQGETRYITHKKSGAAFGLADPSFSAARVVGSIIATIIP